MENVVMLPFDSRQTSLIIKYLELFSQFDTAYVAHRRTIEPKSSDQSSNKQPQADFQEITAQNISFVSPLFTFFTPIIPVSYDCNPREYLEDAMTSGLVLFSTDVVTPPKASFIEHLTLLPPLHPNRLECYIALGMTHILFSLDANFHHIFDVIKIDNRLPVKPLQDGIVVLQEADGEPRRLLFSNAIKGPLSLKIISEFQK